MRMRVYVPMTSSSLASLVADGRLAGPFRAHAVTGTLRADWPDGDDESWEYAALMAAAADSTGLRDEGDAPRRFVLAADVPAFAEVADEGPTLVAVDADVSWGDVAAAHVDTEDDADEDDDLAWFATQEIAHLG